MFTEHKEAGEVAPVKELDEAAKLLLAAAALIEERGWIQDECENERGYCIQGALKAVGGPGEYVWHGTQSHKGYMRVRDAVNHVDGVIGWNDAPGRTQAEVVAKLRAVALGG